MGFSLQYSSKIRIQDIDRSSVVMVAGICNSVGGSVFLTCHHGGGVFGEYLW